ncbi:MAG TPA: hypothetical protein VGR89_03930 [Puia sp.]|nr:hypothetical protein [Puia sp.]
MNIRTFPASFALLSALHAAAQPTAYLTALPAAEIRLSGSTPATGPSRTYSFRHFDVIDLRVDTSRIGIHTRVPDFGPNYDRQLCFRRPAAVEIAAYLNHRFSSRDASLSALVVLRTLWLSDANVIRPELWRHPGRRLERTHIRMKVEIYAFRDNQYLPVLRFDTLQTAWKKRILSETSPYSEWGRNLSLLIDQFADSASRLTAESGGGGRWVDLEAIRRSDSLRFDAPIDRSSPVRGVYASFDEFRNNHPSIIDFEVRVTGRERLLYIRQSGISYYCHDAWGYSDGKNIYIMRDGVLWPAWKEQKAFYIPASARAAAEAASEAPLNPSRDYRRRSIYFVDMDTGDIY